MSTFRYAGIRVPPETQAKLQNLLANPKTRAAASRIINDEGRELVRACTELADTEIRRRPEERRKGTLSEGQPHYNDSFELVPAVELGVDRLRVGVRNTHPAHHLVENGTQPHTISASKAKTLAFPFNGQTGHGGIRQFGPWALTTEESDGATLFAKQVQHTGAAKHEIMRRVLREYRRRAARRLNRSR